MLVSLAKEVLEKSKLYSIEFRTGSNTKNMSICFWEGAHLIDGEMSTILRDIPVVKGKLNLISQFRSALGTRTQILSCGGYNADVLKAFDQDPDRKGVIQYHFEWNPLRLEN